MIFIYSAWIDVNITLKFSRAIIILALLVLAGVATVASTNSDAVIRISSQSSQADRMQVFYDAAGNFSETSSFWGDVGREERRTDFEVRGRDAMWLRLDPPTDAKTTICIIQLGDASLLPQFEIASTAELSVVRDGGCLKLAASETAQDPWVVLRFTGASAKQLNAVGIWSAGTIAAILGLVVGAVFLGYMLSNEWQSLVRFVAFKERAHWYCALLMLIFGGTFLLITPPGAVADEEAHFAKVIRISQGVPFGGSGAQLMPHPRSMYGPLVDYRTNKAPISREQIVERLRLPLACKGTSSQIAEGANGYFPHHYVLSAAAYSIGCAAGASFGSFLYAARALNLLLATFFVCLGIKHATRGKTGLFFVALLPMSVFQMSSLSADALVLSLSVAWLGTVSGVASGTLHPGRITALLWGLSLGIAFLKPGSAWILACLLFCKPAYDAAGVSFRAGIAKHVAVPWIVHILVTLLASGSAKAIVGVDAVQNIHTLTDNPSAFVQALISTFRDHGDRLGESLVGILGWLDVPLSFWAYWAASLMAAAALWSNTAPTSQSPRYVTPLALLAMAGSLVMTSLPLFIYWTPADSSTILGLQGRYFTITAAFGLVWCSLRSPPRIQALFAPGILIGLCAINLDAVYRLYQAYYVVGRL